MASRQRSKEALWPLGTKIKKHFDGHGDFEGEVKDFKDGLYSIEYEDGDTEQFDAREMKRYVLKRPSFLAPPKSASPPKQTSPKKKAAPETSEKEQDEDAEEGSESEQEETTKDAAAAAPENEENRNEKMLRDIDAMHQELEITGYVRGKTGQKRRKIPRSVSKIRTQKRKALERAEAAELAAMAENDEAESTEDEDSSDDEAGKTKRKRKKLRGSRAALEDDVLQASMIFQPAVARGKIGDDSDGEGDQDGAEDDNVDDDDGDEDDREGTAGEESTTKSKPKVGRRVAKKPAPKKKKSAAAGNAVKRTKQRRQMYRLRNFQSFRMAQRHGDALAAHAQGNYRLAIHKLKAVSKDAPSAPQVYASLGMVYEDMLKESKAQYLERKASGDVAATTVLEPEQKDEEANDEAKDEAKDESSQVAPFVPNPFLQEQLNLAKKAYGSHHASAILCKKDFSLWVRSGNCAIDIADLHEEISQLPGISEGLCSAHNAERRRWLVEASRDLLVADNLSPPGIDVPAKLAAIHMDLGNLSEALTILTDLKNRSGHDFHSSYKAWLLYADLMLRFGHECTQWNQNVRTTENYMVRRWLRKHSETFDWQERRTQALALALAAAAGTKCADRFLDWIQKHATDINVNSENTDSTPGGRQGAAKKTGQEESKEGEPSKASSRKEHAQERNLLEGKHQREVEEFDKTTSEMGLVPGSDPEKSRTSARKKLLDSQHSAMGTLESEFTQQEKTANTAAQNEDASIVDSDRNIVPMSASVGVVCSIASDLMKHLIRMELYTGARLASEVVSNYMKERARLVDRALESRRKADEWQQRVINTPFLLDAYHEETGDNDEDETLYLSDEDTLIDTAGETGLLDSLRRGILPPEVRILGGVAMVGEGGRNFVASKYLQAIEDLEQESADWLRDGDEDAQVSLKPRWFFFQRTMTESLTKTVAYAYLADTIKKANKDAEWAFHFLPVFSNHFKVLRETGVVDELIKINNSDISANGIIRRSQVLKVMLATCRLGVNTVVVEDGVTLVLGKKPDLDKASQVKNAMEVLELLDMAASLLWTIGRKGDLSQPCIEIVRTSAKCIVWISKNISESDSVLLEIVKKVQRIVSYFVGGAQIPDLSGVKKEEERKNLLEATRFPLSVTWQPLHYRTLSDRTYNVAAACNVLPFSGWENEKFSSKLLKRRCGTDFFGLHVLGSKVTGCLPSEVEEELKRQWGCFEKLEPDLPSTHFEVKLKQVKNSDWYKRDVESKGGMPDVRTVAKYAEDDALTLFLAYSSLCLTVAGSTGAENSSFRYKQLALSVLLPICRFCLDETKWVIVPQKHVAKTVHAQQAALRQRESPTPVPTQAAKPSEESEKSRETLQVDQATGEQSKTLPSQEEASEKNQETLQVDHATVEQSKILPSQEEASEKSRETLQVDHATVEQSNTTPSQEEAEDSNNRTDFDEWREEAGETIFEPLIAELQHPQWNANLETLVLDHNFPIVGEAPTLEPPPRKRTRKIAKLPTPKTDNWHRPGSGILKKFIPIKCSELKRLWTSNPSLLEQVSEHDARLAKTYMDTVHSCVQNLRACFTFSAAEKNCLDLSVALLDVAVSPCCKDPFTCLQQASMYASQASKAGNSDMSFRREIPSVHDCTPRIALAILGRADCMHAVFFPEEAAFLCSFVARACALRRNPSTTYEWNDQWKVVGMYAYNVSVMIRATVNGLMNQNKPKVFAKMWEPSVIEELKSGRRDARDLSLLAAPDLASATEIEPQEGVENRAEDSRDGDQDQDEASVRSIEAANTDLGNQTMEQSNNAEAPLLSPGVVVYGV